MAKTYLNEALKARAASQTHKQNNGEIALDDVSRVKVLSPGRQVFKRFIRNRLAVFGSVLLITMFVFSFLGPLVYPYGQKQIFYKYDNQVVNYAMAKENTAYNGYDVDASVEIERSVVNVMNSNIKKMIADGDQEEMFIFSDSGVFLIQKVADEIYTLSAVTATEIATTGEGTVNIGTYSQITKSIDYKGDAVEGLAEALADQLKGNSGSVELDGVTYKYKKAQAKNFTITTDVSGTHYLSAPLDESFEAAMEKAIANGATSFQQGGVRYLLAGNGNLYTVYKMGAVKTAKVFTRLMVDTYEIGAPVSQELRVGALLNAAKGGSFTADGQSYSVSREDDMLVVRDAEGKEYAEFTIFSVRRYNGDDTMAYDLKRAVEETVRDMIEKGLKEASFTYDLPQQSENGEYVYDEAGNLQYQQSELTISRRDMSGSDKGEYVITAEQVIYVIDMFSKPTAKHILGTDGDGFDVMSRIMYGGRVSLMVGFVVVFLECFLGIIMGGLAGYYGGWVDMLIMRLVDIFYCLPSMPIMIILGAMMDALRMNTYVRLMIMMAALGIMGWAGVARLVRGQILSLREQEFMVATEATGIKVKDRIFHHLVPNVMPQLIVQATMGMGGVIITESTLSFLGLGVKHPLATWGTIINSVSSASAMAHYAHIWIPVGLLICVTVIAFNFVGDGLRDAYDPKAKR